MATIRRFQDLDAWNKAFQLGLTIYDVTRHFPDEERFGLTSQLRRGAVSVASNIAEGFGRGSRQDYERFVRIARGALYELETQLLFARELKYMTGSTHENVQLLLEESGRLIGGLLRSLQRSS